MKKNIQNLDLPAMVDILRSRVNNQPENLAFTHKTIERLPVCNKREENPDLPDGVIPIRSGGVGTAQFLVHDVSGEII